MRKLSPETHAALAAHRKELAKKRARHATLLRQLCEARMAWRDAMCARLSDATRAERKKAAALYSRLETEENRAWHTLKFTAEEIDNLTRGE